MKLVRFGSSGEEKPGLLIRDPSGQEAILDVGAMAFDIHDYDSHFFTHHGLERLRNLLKEEPRHLIPAGSVRLGPPVPPPLNLICVGLNYRSHAEELNLPLPDEPLLFAKAPTSIAGPQDPLHLPDGAAVDFEVELAVVLSRPAHHVSPAEARSCIAGFTILNDVTDRNAQARFSQWYAAKSYAGFCPLGPWLLTPDEVPSPLHFKLESYLNGKLFQSGQTSDMIFSVEEVISYASRYIPLQAGDVISTGTPPGIASRHLPPIFLKPGDEIRLCIEHLGCQQIRVYPSA